MRKLFYLTFAVLLSFSSIVSAQENSPSSDTSATSPKAFVQGGLGLNMCQGDCKNIDSSYGINLSGFFNVKPNLYAGASIYYGDYGIDNGSLYTFTFAPEVSYIMTLPSNPQVSVFGLGGIGYTKGKLKIDTPLGGGSSSDSAYSIFLGGGASYNLNPLMSVGLVLKYQYNIWGDWSDNNSDFNHIFIGAVFSYVLPL